jgi:hypothetical protein
MKEAEGGAVTLDPHRLLTVVLELHRRGRQMKEVEGGAAAMDPRHLPTVVLELRRRGRRMKEVEGGTTALDPVRDSSTDFARHRGARDGRSGICRRLHPPPSRSSS